MRVSPVISTVYYDVILLGGEAEEAAQGAGVHSSGPAADGERMDEPHRPPLRDRRAHCRRSPPLLRFLYTLLPGTSAFLFEKSLHHTAEHKMHTINSVSLLQFSIPYSPSHCSSVLVSDSVPRLTK
jgi:hypothetical protein